MTRSVMSRQLQSQHWRAYGLIWDSATHSHVASAQVDTPLRLIHMPDIPHLEHLRLRRYHVAFNIFKGLKSLRLSDLGFDLRIPVGHFLASLDSCPLLEHLSMTRVMGLLPELGT